jgi:predicted secreted protein
MNHHPATAIPGGNDTNGKKKETGLPKDTMEIKNNTEFNIEIRAALSTGKQWMLEDSLDKNYLALVRSTIVTDSTEMAANPDLQIFVFKTLQKGSASISFVYKRPWKKNADPNAERKKYFIKII